MDARDDALLSLRIDPTKAVVLPFCDARGLWERVQCNIYVGVCWCVDPQTGSRVTGSQVRGTPLCSQDGDDSFEFFDSADVSSDEDSDVSDSNDISDEWNDDVTDSYESDDVTGDSSEWDERDVTESSLEGSDVTDDEYVSDEDHTEAYYDDTDENLDEDEDSLDEEDEEDSTEDDDSSSNESSDVTDDQPVCASGADVFSCSPLLCLYSVCAGHPSAQCRVNPCDGCSVQWFDGTDDVTDQCSNG